MNFKYRHNPDEDEIDQAQSIAYTAFITDSLSSKWSLVVIITPGLASDFEGDHSDNCVYLCMG